MSEGNEARSPVLTLAKHIAGSAFAIAPERSATLRETAPKFSLAFTDEKGFRIRVNMTTHEAKFPVATLEYIWSCANLCWVLYQAYVSAQERGDAQLDMASDGPISEAVDLLNWAVRNQAESGIDAWPSAAPSPLGASTNIEVADELFLAAVAWIMHHEIAHVRAQHPAVDAIYAVKQELEADQMATDWIFGECHDQAQRKKRQLGMITALLAMQLLDRPTGADTYVASHPPTVERIYACLDQAKVDDDGAARGVALVVMQWHLAQHDLSVPLDGPSIKDILADALITFRTSQRVS